jgi:MFS transporter, PPP family, 3-phenylpropionic acid transporter
MPIVTSSSMRGRLRGINGEPFARRLAFYYAGLFTVLGMQMPLLPVWLAANGLDSREIGLALAVPMAVRLVSVPVVARIADRRSALRGTLIAISAIAAAGYLGVGLAHGFASILVMLAVAAAAFTPAMPLADAYAVIGLTRRAKDYGPVRLWGSAAFIAANLAAGLLLDAIRPLDFIWVIAATAVLMTAAAFGLRPLAAGAGTRISPRSSYHRIARDPALVLFVSAASLIQASHAVFYGFGTLDWLSKGLNGATIGALWGLGVAAEIALFAMSARLPATLTPTTLVVIGAISAVARWSVMALDPRCELLPALQCLHGLSFGATHLGSMQLVAEIAPDRHGATTQGDFTTIQAVVMMAATAVSGAFYASFGSSAYAAMAVLAALGGILLIVARVLRGSRQKETLDA